MWDGLCKGKSGGRGTSREAAAKVRPDIVASTEVVQMEAGGHRRGSILEVELTTSAAGWDARRGEEKSRITNS